MHLNSINGLRAVHQIGPRYTSMGLCVEVVPGETERGLPEEQAEGETVAVTWANARQVWQMIHPWGFGIGDFL